MSRIFTATELENLIDNIQENYKTELSKLWGEENKVKSGKVLAKIEALEEFRTELNDPTPIVNVSENVQQTTNVITTQNIVNDEL